MTKVKLKSKRGAVIEYEIAHAERILVNQDKKRIKGFTLDDTNFEYKGGNIVRRKPNTGDSKEGTK